MPGCKLGKENKPSGPDVVFATDPVATEVRVNCALGTAAPVGSATVPLMVALVLCAIADAGSSSDSGARMHDARKPRKCLFFILTLPRPFDPPRKELNTTTHGADVGMNLVAPSSARWKNMHSTSDKQPR